MDMDSLEKVKLEGKGQSERGSVDIEKKVSGPEVGEDERVHIAERETSFCTPPRPKIKKEKRTRSMRSPQQAEESKGQAEGTRDVDVPARVPITPDPAARGIRRCM